METEHEICRRYESQLAEMAALDRRYYINPNPTLADRAAYAARQALLADTRSRFYSEIGQLRVRRQLRRYRLYHPRIAYSTSSWLRDQVLQ